MRAFILILGLVLITSLHTRPAASQDAQAAPTLGWLTLGLGGGTGTGQDPMAIGAEFSVQRGAHLFSGRALAFGEIFSVESEATELALLYGRATTGKKHQTGFSAGLAFLKCQRRSFCGKGGLWDEGEGSQSTVGLALSGQLFWTPASVFGLGIYGFASLSPQGSAGGVMLGLRFGKLR